jgi:hypothetical protein
MKNEHKSTCCTTQNDLVEYYWWSHRVLRKKVNPHKEPFNISGTLKIYYRFFF